MPDTVASLGGLISCLDIEQLNKLDDAALNFDAMSRVGTYGDWSDPQKVLLMGNRGMQVKSGQIGEF